LIVSADLTAHKSENRSCYRCLNASTHFRR